MRSFVLASQPTCAKRESTLMRSAHVQTTGAHLSTTQRLRFIRGNISHKTSWSTVLSSALWKIGAPCETSISASLFFQFFSHLCKDSWKQCFASSIVHRLSLSISQCAFPPRLVFQPSSFQAHLRATTQQTNVFRRAQQ